MPSRFLLSKRSRSSVERKRREQLFRQMQVEPLEPRHLLTFDSPTVNITASYDDEEYLEASNPENPYYPTAALYSGYNEFSPEFVVLKFEFTKDDGVAATGVFENAYVADVWFTPIIDAPEWFESDGEPHLPGEFEIPEDVTSGLIQIVMLFPEDSQGYLQISGDIYYHDSLDNIIDEAHNITILETHDRAEGRYQSTCPSCSCPTDTCFGEVNNGGNKSTVTATPTATNSTNYFHDAGKLGVALIYNSAPFIKPVLQFSSDSLPGFPVVEEGGPFKTTLTVRELHGPATLTPGVPYTMTKSEASSVKYYAEPTDSDPFMLATEMPTSGLSLYDSGLYDFEYKVEQGENEKTYYGQVYYEVPNQYPEWGPGWSLEGMMRLDVVDTNLDDQMTYWDAKWSNGLTLNFGGGSRARIPNWRPDRESDDDGYYGEIMDGDLAGWVMEITQTHFILIDPHLNKRYFNFKGEMVKYRDHYGNDTNYSYGGNGITGISYPTGRSVSFIYDGTVIMQVVDSADGAVMQFNRSSGRISEVLYQDPDGPLGPKLRPREEFTFSGYLLTSRTRFPDENEITADITTYTYYGDGRLQSMTKPTAATIYYDPAVYLGMGSSSEGSPAALVKVVDAFGVITQGGLETKQRFDFRGRMIEEIDPAGGEWDYGYGTYGAASVATPDPDGAGGEGRYNQSFDYASSGLLLDVGYPDGSSEVFQYGTTGGSLRQVTKYTNRRQNDTYYEYDLDRNLVKIQQVIGEKDGVGNSETDDLITELEYGSAPLLGIPDAIINPRGYRTELTYNGLGQPTSITYAVGTALEATVEYAYDAAGRVTSITNELEIVTDTFAYDALGRLIEHAMLDPDGGGPAAAPVYLYEYTRENRLAKVTDPLGREVRWEYQVDGDYVEIRPDHDGDSDESVTSYTMDSLGRLESVEDALGSITSYQYNELGLPVTVTLPDASLELLYTYDALGRTKSATDALGNTTDYAYASGGNVVTTTLPSPDGIQGRPAYTYTHDAHGNLITYSGPTSGAAFEYDDADRLSKAYGPRIGGGVPTEVYKYDKNGNVTTLEETIGYVSPYNSSTPLTVRTTTMTYDERDRMLTKTLPDTSVVWEYGWDDASQLVEVEDPEDGITAYGYDLIGRLVTVDLPEVNSVSPQYGFVYDAASHVVREVDPLGNYTQRDYDDHDNLIETGAYDDNDAPLSVQKMGYDDLGRLLWSNINSGTTGYSYNAMGWLEEVLLPDPDDAMVIGSAYSDTASSQPRPEISYTHDDNGNVVTQTNEIGETTAFAYDDLNRLITRTDPTIAAGSPVTTFGYDLGNRLTSLQDPAGNDTIWTYNALDQVLTEKNELNATRTFTYDILGNLTKSVDRLGREIRYTYDSLDRQTAEVWYGASGGGGGGGGGSSSGSAVPIARYDYGYDKLSRMTSADGQDVANSEVWANFDYAYDPLSRLTDETVQQPNFITVELENDHDLAGRRTSVGVGFTANSTTTDDFVNDYTRDGLGRLTSVKQHGQTSGNVVAEKYVTFDYNEQSQLTEIVRFADLSGTEFVAQTDYDRDFLGRLTQLDTFQGATHFATYDLEYDAASRITAIDSVFSNSAWNENHDYTYDDNNQLTAANHSVQNDEAYAYDKNGNRTGNQTHLGATTSSTVASDNRISTDGVYNYTWDNEGNMLTKTKISNSDKEEYTWDYRNRLTKVTFKAGGSTITKTIEFRYDHANRMLRRIETPYMYGSPQTAERDILVHDGDQIVLAFHKSGSGTLNLTNRYLWGPQQDLLLTDEQVTSLGSAGTVYWAFLNQVGSVVDLATYNAGTDTTTVVKHRKYDEFGNITSDSASGIKQRFAFTGKWFEESFGATWHIFRWYDTFLGKWKSQDPIKDRVNWSAYVGNRPTYAVDPDGLEERKDGLGGTSGWLSDNSQYYLERSKDESKGFLDRFGSGVLSIINGMSVGPAALVDAVPGAIHQSAEDSRGKIAQSLETNPDPVNQVMGRCMYGLSFAGEFNAQWANAYAVQQTAGRLIPVPRQPPNDIRTGVKQPQYPKDYSTRDTKNWSGTFKSEGEARNFARSYLGRNPVEVEPGKFRSQCGKWQYRAKPGDISERHIHLEEIDPKTGRVLQNLHLRWPEKTGR